jgi:hypothetical protein
MELKERDDREDHRQFKAYLAAIHGDGHRLRIPQVC